MQKFMQKFMLAAGILSSAVSLAALEPGAPISKDKGSLSLDGYDVVAYFAGAKNKKGSPEWSSDYRDATWYFTSKENKELFDQDPEKYMPEFGGYCVYAISKKGIAKGSGKHGQIVDGKLYFNANSFAQTLYNLNRSKHNKNAGKNWEGVKQKIFARK